MTDKELQEMRGKIDAASEINGKIAQIERAIKQLGYSPYVAMAFPGDLVVGSTSKKLFSDDFISDLWAALEAELDREQAKFKEL